MPQNHLSNSNPFQSFLLLIILPTQLFHILFQLHIPILDFLIIALYSLQNSVTDLVYANEFTADYVLPLVGLAALYDYFLA